MVVKEALDFDYCLPAIYINLMLLTITRQAGCLFGICILYIVIYILEVL